MFDNTNTRSCSMNTTQVVTHGSAQDFMRTCEVTEEQFGKMMEIAEQPISDAAVRSKVKKEFGAKIAKVFMQYIMY